MLFRCEYTPGEMVDILRKPEFEDNISYEFEVVNGVAKLGVTKVPYQLGKRKPVWYRLSFEMGTEDLFLRVEPMDQKGKGRFTSSTQEPELYRFFIEKCDCEPVKEIV